VSFRVVDQWKAGGFISGKFFAADDVFGCQKGARCSRRYGPAHAGRFDLAFGRKQSGAFLGGLRALKNRWTRHKDSRPFIRPKKAQNNVGTPWHGFSENPLGRPGGSDFPAAWAAENENKLMKGGSLRDGYTIARGGLGFFQRGTHRVESAADQKLQKLEKRGLFSWVRGFRGPGCENNFPEVGR